MWWYGFWQFLAAQAQAPPPETAFERLDDGRIVLDYRGRRGIGALLIVVGLPGGVLFLLAGLSLVGTAVGLPADADARFRSTVICGIAFPFFMLLLRGMDELLRRRRILIDETGIAVRQGGLFVRSPNWRLPRTALRGVGLYSKPHFGLNTGGSIIGGPDWHLIDLVFAGTRRGPIVLHVGRDAAAAEALRRRICRALDVPPLDPPDGRRGPTQRYLLQALGLCLLPMLLSLLAAMRGAN